MKKEAKLVLIPHWPKYPDILTKGDIVYWKRDNFYYKVTHIIPCPGDHLRYLYSFSDHCNPGKYVDMAFENDKGFTYRLMLMNDKNKCIALHQQISLSEKQLNKILQNDGKCFVEVEYAMFVDGKIELISAFQTDLGFDGLKLTEVIKEIKNKIKIYIK